jgi:hypothetical protein
MDHKFYRSLTFIVDATGNQRAMLAQMFATKRNSYSKLPIVDILQTGLHSIVGLFTKGSTFFGSTFVGPVIFLPVYAVKTVLYGSNHVDVSAVSKIVTTI